MDSVFDSDSKGCRFESCRARHKVRDVAQLGSALASGARGRVFKSRRPDHLFSFGDLAQMEEHNAGSVGVVGSSPIISTNRETKPLRRFLFIQKGLLAIMKVT